MKKLIVITLLLLLSGCNPKPAPLTSEIDDVKLIWTTPEGCKVYYLSPNILQYPRTIVICPTGYTPATSEH